MAQLETILRKELLFDDFQKVDKIFKENNLDKIICDFIDDQLNAFECDNCGSLEDEISDLENEVEEVENKLLKVKLIINE